MPGPSKIRQNAGPLPSPNQAAKDPAETDEKSLGDSPAARPLHDHHFENLPLLAQNGTAGIRPHVPGSPAPAGPVAAGAATTTVATANPREKKEYIADSIHFFEMAASFYGDSLTAVDPAAFERTIQSWYVIVTDREKMITDLFNKDPVLMHSLQSAYRTAISALISKAAPSFKISVDDLYKKNNGRIPIWAWQIPHHKETGITTPLPEGHSPDILTGNVDFSFSNLSVTLLPDGIDNSLNLPAATGIHFRHGAVHWIERNGKAEQMTGPGMSTATIQTLYKPGVVPKDSSGYGRGTTPEDKRGALVNPDSATLGFHEAAHGLDYLEYLNTHPFPVFKGTSGMKVSRANFLLKEFLTAFDEYYKDIVRFTEKNTHCVGLTIDEYNQAHAPAHAKIKLECTIP